MLDFLVTSKARRRLLRELWGQRATGSTARLAELAGVGFASAYRELHAMQELRLVVSEREGAAEVFRANEAHPLADTLRKLTSASASANVVDDRGARQVRGELAALGAPLQQTSHSPRGSVEETLVHGVQLAHRDPTVARTLPVCLFRQRNNVSPEKLRQLALQTGEKRALGFFLTLTAKLSGDPRFDTWAESLRDRRCKATRPFFCTTPRSRRQTHLEEEETPEVARTWGLRMNMNLDVFRSHFEKFVHAA